MRGKDGGEDEREGVVSIPVKIVLAVCVHVPVHRSHHTPIQLQDTINTHYSTVHTNRTDMC